MAIRWGIIGCGDVCEVKSGPGFQKAEGSELVAVMRRTPGQAEDFACRHHVPRWYTDVSTLIADPEIDAVYIATPPGSHLEISRLVALAGKPAYIEKPMARNAAECREMIKLFKAANTPLFVAYYRRSLPRFQKVAELFPQLGALRKVSYTFTRNPLVDLEPLPWRLEVEQSGGGLFLDIGCHALDLLDHLLGPLEQVSGNARNIAGLYDVEDTVSLNWTWASGTPGSAEFQFSGNADRDEFVFEGEKGSLRAACFDTTPIRLQLHDEPEESIEAPNPDHVHQPMIQAVTDELTGKGASPSSGRSAVRTNLVMDAVLSAYYAGRTDAFWTRAAQWPK
ncbi:MAG: 1,5-anhydro-D-fructose reductase (1,5-anhydro-D-mannitol-forming) [Limisphaerales bacterium]|jgi:1,5-anhydro-D-fructose reductase (1,5-anhydro-D-mannitol-forming)